MALTCLTAMLIRREFIDPSINTFSFSFLLITTGANNSSLLLLQTHIRYMYTSAIKFICKLMLMS